MKLKEKRKELNIEQTDLAVHVGTNVPMISNFERYKCLPVPTMLKAICKVLKCEVLDIYEANEIYIKEADIKSQLKVALREKPCVYRLTADLPNYAREILNSKNLEKCGYHSLKDFIWHCFKRFEKRLKAIEKATKHSNCSVANENGYENTLSH